MLPQKNRIPRSLFESVLKEGSVFHSPHLYFRVVKTQSGLSKFSFVVSKKVSKSAVSRNLLRRRGYSIIRSLFGKEKMNAGIIGAFFFKKGAEKIDFAALREEIWFLLKKVGMIPPP